MILCWEFSLSVRFLLVSSRVSVQKSKVESQFVSKEFCGNCQGVKDRCHILLLVQSNYHLRT